MKKLLGILLCVTMLCTTVAVSLAEEALPNFLTIKVGEEYLDLTASIKYLTHRTDLTPVQNSTAFQDKYIAEFNKLYPNIKVEVEAVTDYAQDALVRLTGSDDWGDVMNIPQVENSEFGTFFLPYGTVEEMSKYINFADAKQFEGLTYGIPTTANFQGVLYNKAVFEKAGVTEIPRTPEAFIDALQKIKDNTDAIPLYTNYAAGWTMGAWDFYAGVGATGKPDFVNIDMISKKDPFADQGNGTGPYAVYKILYDATQKGLIEEDYTTTDWESCKPKLNNGQIATMMLGSWAYVQMRDAVGGEHPDDVAYMPFPITVDGKQYALSAADYCYGINAKTDKTRQLASMIFVKWMVEKGGFNVNEGGSPVLIGESFPAFASSFDGVTMLSDTMVDGDQAQLVDNINADSTLMFAKGGNEKIQKIIEHAFSKDMSFDDVTASWNQLWSDAQASLGITVK
jgi:raffinose/stachyose/melibiose transport system substrate-binding protein